MATTSANQPSASTLSSGNKHGSSVLSPNASAASGSKRNKNKKAPDPANTSKAIEDTIAQLERNRAGDKEQELEIEREVRRANRDLSHLLSTLETPMSRSDTVQKKYTELLTDMKRTEREYIKTKKRADQLQKEKDQKTSELSKMTIVKDKLEKLCRELQKENKKLKDDNKRVCETETRMREELHDKLEHMVMDVEEIIELKENPGSMVSNQPTDDIFRQKFKALIEQYELRELQFHSILRMKDFDVQYQAARYEQQRRAQEQEANKSRQLTSQVSTFSQTETELRSQLNIYVEKFKQVEDTLNNSNDLFLTFRKEMEEMSKKTKRLEKENLNLTRKHELTSHNVLQMAEERTKLNKEMDLLRKRNDNLEKLCRGMQNQGRQVPGVDPHSLASGQLEESEGTESEYEYEDDEEEEEDEDDDDEDEESEPTAHDQNKAQERAPAGTTDSDGGISIGTSKSHKPKSSNQRGSTQKPARPPATGSSAKTNSGGGGSSQINGVKH